MNRNEASPGGKGRRGKAVPVAGALLLGAVLASVPCARAAELRVGLVPAESPEVTDSLAAGARWALEEARRGDGPTVELLVGESAASAGTWATTSAAVVDLAHRRQVLALITPPDRTAAHVMAQIGTRSQIPVISTACAASVTATGSWWVVAVVEPCTAEAAPAEGGATAPLPAGAEAFAAAYRERFGGEPDGWTVAGYDAASVVLEAVRRGGGTRRAFVAELRDDFTAAGATGPIRFTEQGARRTASVEPETPPFTSP